MSQTSAPSVNPLPAGTAPAAAAPQAASPGVPASPAPSAGAPTLSTASLTASIAAQLRGEKPVVAVTGNPPAVVPGTEPSPGTGAGAGQPDGATQNGSDGTDGTDGSNDAPHDDDDGNPPDNALPPQAVAALAQGREQRRELKKAIKGKDEMIGQLQDTLLKMGDRLAALESGDGRNGTNGTNGANGTPKAPKGAAPSNAPMPPELAQAEQAEAQARDMKQWTSSRLRDLNRALARGDDAEPVLASLRSELAAHHVTVPGSAEEAQGWLESLRDNAEEQLADLRVTTRVLRQSVAQDSAVIRQESEALLARWVPEVADTASPRAAKLAKLKAAFPMLESHPLGARFLGAAIRGWEVVESEGRGAGKNGTNGTNGTHAPATAPARPVPVLPGASSTTRPTTQQPNGLSSHFARMANAKTPEEVAAAKADWEKSLAGNLALH